MKKTNQKLKLLVAVSLILNFPFISSSAESLDQKVGTFIKEAFQRLERSKNLELYFEGLAKSDGVQVLSDKVLSQSQSFVTREIILAVPKVKNFGTIRLKKRDPIDLLGQRLPTIFLLSGAMVGADAIDLVPEVPGISVVTMDYGISEVPRLERALDTIKKLWSIQASYVIAYSWLSRQEDVNPFELSSVNVSFGNYLVPFPLRVLKAVGLVPKATVFAFGGSSLMPFVRDALNKELSPENVVRVEKFLEPLVEALDPTRHLQHLEGPFLLVKASKDQIIPEQSFLALEAALQGPKDIYVSKGGHIDVDQAEIIQDSVRYVFEWLSQQAQSSPIEF